MGSVAVTLAAGCTGLLHSLFRTSQTPSGVASDWLVALVMLHVVARCRLGALATVHLVVRRVVLHDVSVVLP